ncbi:SigE family RNA polymerase sigma factor [Flindersiella endophytica]
MGLDPREFSEFASTRTQQLFRTAYLLTGNRQMAEELVQVTLGKLYASWSRTYRVENPVAYAHTVLARSYVADRKRNSREVPTETVPEHAATERDVALRIALFEALAHLSPRDRAIVVLRYWEDRSVEGTAAVLNLRPGVVRTRSMRALARLRVLLGSDINDLAGR